MGTKCKARTGRNADYSPPSSTEVKNEQELYYPHSCCLHDGSGITLFYIQCAHIAPRQWTSYVFEIWVFQIVLRVNTSCSLLCIHYGDDICLSDCSTYWQIKGRITKDCICIRIATVITASTERGSQWLMHTSPSVEACFK
jgi:hypothetical protein